MTERVIVRCPWCNRTYVSVVGELGDVTVEFRCLSSKCGKWNAVKLDKVLSQR